MKPILRNPYRILGLLAGASAREQDRQVKRLRQLIDAEQEIPVDFSFPELRDLDRTIETVNEASSRLNLDADKLAAALFWFTFDNPITDEAAFDALKEGDSETAIDIWRRLAYAADSESYQQVTKKNASAFHNLSTAYLAEYGLDADTLSLKLLFLESDSFLDFKSKITDETYHISKIDAQLVFLNTLAAELDDPWQLIEYLSDLEFEAKDEYLNRFIQKPIQSIEDKIEQAKNKRNAEKNNALKAGQKLWKECKDELEKLESLLSESDLKYATIADKLANEILQCSIDYFNNLNHSEAEEDNIEPALKLARISQSIAVGKMARDRIEENLETMAEIKERSLTQAIQLLNSIKEAYLEKKKEIEDHIKHLEETDTDLILGHKSIDKDAVQRGIRDCLDWVKINELLKSELSDDHLVRIKGSIDFEKKKEFTELAKWLKTTTPKANVISSIIDKYSKIPPDLPFVILSSEVSNTENKPLFTKFIKYIGLRLKIEPKKEVKILFYLKYINPSGKYKFTSNISPNGYTYSFVGTINSEKKFLDLSGWGSKDTCTYEIGEHIIEVYVDEYLIHSKKFVVELSPADKIENEIKNIEAEIEKVKQNKYFKSELDVLKAGMDKIKEWQFMRSQSEKERQIYEQQVKINELNKKSEQAKRTEEKKLANKLIDLKEKLKNTEF